MKRLLMVLSITLLLVGCATSGNLKDSPCDKKGILVASTRLAILLDYQKKGEVVSQSDIDSQIQVIADKTASCTGMKSCGISEEVSTLVYEVKKCADNKESCNKYLLALAAIDIADEIERCNQD